MTNDTYEKAKSINSVINRLNNEIEFLSHHEKNKETLSFDTKSAKPKHLYEEFKAEKLILSVEEISVLLKMKKNELFRLLEEFHEL